MNYLNDVSTLKLDENKCIQCLRCIQVCPRQVFSFEKTLIISNINQCIECGACEMNCPTKALQVEKGVGCFSAIAVSYLKKNRFLRKFIKDGCC